MSYRARADLLPAKLRPNSRGTLPRYDKIVGADADLVGILGIMASPTYPAARLVADSVQRHFARHIAARSDHNGAGVAPSPLAIESIIDAAFWASLRREEGQAPKISLAFLPPEDARHALLFASRLPLGPSGLSKVAPAVERPGIHLGVWCEGDQFFVWGTTREVPPFCLVVEVVASGLIVVKHRAEPFGKFVNVAVLEGDQIKIVDEAVGRVIPDCPELVSSLTGANDHRSASGVTAVLIQLAASMRQHGRGGALLVVPAGTDSWRESIVAPVLYAVNPPYSELSQLVRSKNADPDDLKREVDAIAGLTAVDGATIIDDRYDLLAFGAKISRRRGGAQVEFVNMTEPVEGSTPTRATPALLGGTRHLSAAQFVSDQHESMALVASQDGRFTIFKWSNREQHVHGHRVDALLL
jgi:DNA integrity scanning protein DisA with diadenylate cyclase activity